MSDNPEVPPTAPASAPEAGEPKEQKPDVSTGEHINLKVAGQDGSEVHFKIKRTTPLRKLMEAYCQRSGLRLADVRFVSPEGARILPDQNPKDLELEDNDSIDVMHQQTGGC